MITTIGAPQIEQTVAGDEVSTRLARFRSQQEQIDFLRDMVEEYRGVAAIRARARDIIFRVYNAPPRDELAYAIAIGRWVQGNIRYVKEMPEVFQTPTSTVAQGYGDCDDMATLVASLLESVGIESELVGLEWDVPGQGRAFQHIFPRAVIRRSGREMRVPLDTSLDRPVDQLTDPIRVAVAHGLRLRVYIA